MSGTTNVSGIGWESVTVASRLQANLCHSTNDGRMMCFNLHEYTQPISETGVLERQ